MKKTTDETYRPGDAAAKNAELRKSRELKQALLAEAKSGIAAIEQDVQVQHVQRLTKMQWRAESYLLRVVGVVQGIAGD